MKRTLVIALAGGALVLALASPALAGRLAANREALAVMRGALTETLDPAGPAPAAQTPTACRLYAAQVRLAPSPQVDSAFLEECLGAGRGDGPIRIALAQVYAGQRDLPAAVRVLRDGRQMDLWLLNQAQAAVDTERPAEALVLLEQSEGWATYPSNMLLVKARSHAALGDTGAALAAYEAALAADDFDPERSESSDLVALYELGRLAADDRQWERAIDAFRRLVDRSPRSASGWMRLGMAYYSGPQDYAQAEAALRASLNFANMDWAHLWLARVLAASGRVDEAIAEYLAAYRINRHEPFLDELLQRLPAAESAKAAADAYAELVRLAPQNGTVLAAAAGFAELQGDAAQAVELYRRALAQEENSAWRARLDALTGQAK